jgi:E3 ubiquitin-protein ligase TRIP12
MAGSVQLDPLAGSSTAPSPSNNGSLLMNAIYHGAALPDTNVMRNFHPSLQEGNDFSTQPSRLFPSSLVQTANEALTFAAVETPLPSVSERSGGPSKVSDILKRKVPPKRKSQHNSKSKNRLDESQSASASVNPCTSGNVVQELFNKANLGTPGRSNPPAVPSSSATSSRSRFSGASSKTSSFLASLNPVRWGRTSSSHSAISGSSNLGKDSLNNLSKSVSNSNLIAAGNREKARQWIRDQSIMFVKRYRESSGAHPAMSILARLTAAIQKLDGSFENCLAALEELRNILLGSDISPFEVNHSGLIKAMLSYMTNDDGNVSRNDRLRSFLFVFAGLPLDGK